MNLINQQLRDYLVTRGVSSANELAKALGVSQPTISRALKSLGTERVLRIGRAMLARVRELSGQTGDLIQEKDRKQRYPELAERSLRGEWPGSSAAGEQPKFLAVIADASTQSRHVLVKFSGQRDQPQTQRWSDLLHSEYHANRVLAEAGESCALSRIVHAADRTFLD